MNCLCRPSRIMSVRINLLDETEFIHEIKVSRPTAPISPPFSLDKHGQLFRFHPYVIMMMMRLKSVLWPQKVLHTLHVPRIFRGASHPTPCSSIFSAGPCDLANMQSVIIHTSIAADVCCSIALGLKLLTFAKLNGSPGGVSLCLHFPTPSSLAGKNCADFARHLVVGIMVRANQINCCDSSGWPGFRLFDFSRPLQNLVPIKSE